MRSSIVRIDAAFAILNINTLIFFTWWTIKQVQITAKMLCLGIRAKASTVTPIKFSFGGQKMGKGIPLHQYQNLYVKLQTVCNETQQLELPEYTFPLQLY